MQLEITTDLTTEKVIVSSSIASALVTGSGDCLADALAEFNNALDKLIYDRVTDGLLELTPELRLMLGITAEGMADEDWLSDMEFEERRPKFNAAISMHYPTLHDKHWTQEPHIVWDGLSDDADEESRWVYENQIAAQWDLINNGPTGKIWCKFIRLAAPLTHNPAGNWQKWEDAGLPLPPKPSDLPQPAREVQFEDLLLREF
jgi:hypothetical protein